MLNKKRDTSWGKVAGWYDKLVENKGSYQTSLILPNLLRILDIKSGIFVADIACGQGFFSREFARLGARVEAVDVSKELIDLSVKNTPPSIRPKITYHVSKSDNLSFLKSGSLDAAVIVLALQNIESVKETLSECSRALKIGGRLVIVLNHPAFRIPKASSWGWDEAAKIQYRRIDRYLSESREKISMHPGDDPEEMTISFHRPLQFYFKALSKNNFLISRFEEWTSDRKSGKGPRAAAEDSARKEIPLFLCIEAVKK